MKNREKKRDLQAIVTSLNRRCTCWWESRAQEANMLSLIYLTKTKTKTNKSDEDTKQDSVFLR